MGTPDTRRAVHVPESTWRKAKVLAAAYGVPISDIVTEAIEAFAHTKRAEVSMRLGGGEHDKVPSRRRSKRDSAGA